MLAVILLAATSTTLLYLYLLHLRIQSTLPGKSLKSRPFPTDEQLLDESEGWDKNALAGSPVGTATGKRYLITGGSVRGSVGSELVKLLLQRGEKNVFILDLATPPQNIRELSGYQYVKTDLSKLNEVQHAFDVARPDVVFHVGSIIRPQERRSFMLRYSWGPNVTGTQNIITCLQALPESSDKILVYCSSAGIEVPRMNYARLWFGQIGFTSPFYRTKTMMDEHPISEKEYQKANYQITKREADNLVRTAHGKDGIKAGVLRPGMALLSTKDLMFSDYLRNPGKQLPCINPEHAAMSMDVRDLGVAHLCYEDALRNRPSEVGGQAFLVSGDTDIWTNQELIHAYQVFGARLNIVYLPHLLLYLLSHAVEMFVIVRYYTLLAINRYILGNQEIPTLYPKYLMSGDLFKLQPGYWDCALCSTKIDDTRARKLLDYKPTFSNAQTHRWVYETIQEELRSAKKVDDTVNLTAPMSVKA